jgi:uncharacterized protein (DUF2267 family)
MQSENFDALVLKLMQGLINYAQQQARSSVEQILQVSSSFLSKEAHDRIKNFYSLYFDATNHAKSERINVDVDRLIEEVRDNIHAESAKDDSHATRVTLANLQKQLETLIALEEGLRQKLQPVLASMQFEDALTQRLSHIQAWFEKFATGGWQNPNQVAEEVGKILSSGDERKAFFPKVLGKDPPAEIEETSLLFDLVA